MKFRLRYSTIYKDGLGQWNKETAPAYFLVRTGDQWPNAPQFRLIDATSPRAADAKLFDTEESARECWSECGKPAQWTVEEATP